jgi:pilus assembly protein CpaB
VEKQIEQKETLIPKTYNVRILILSVIIAIVAILLLNRITAKKTAEFQNLISILVAREDIPKGTIIERSMIAKRDTPAEFFSENYIRTVDLDKILELKTTVDIMKGDPLSKNYFLAEMIESGLSIKIPENNRAITIGVTTVTGLAGMLKPNDRVDVIGTFDVTYKSGKSETITKLLLQNVSVLAVGNVTSDEYIMERSRLGFRDIRAPSRRQYNSVTLMVTVEEAELITFAERYGDLRLVLRRWDDENILSDVGAVDFDELFVERKVQEEIQLQPRKRRTIHYER